MKKRILSAFLAAAMATCCFSGCSDPEKKQSSEASSKLTEETTEATEAETEDAEPVTETTEAETEAPTEKETEEQDDDPFKFRDFRLTSADDFTIDDSDEYFGAELCLASKDAPVIVTFLESSSYGVTSYGHAESFAADNEKDEEYSNITFRKCPEYAMDTSVINYVTTENDKTSIVDMYYICEQASKLDVIVIYTEGYEDDAKQAADKIINSIEYTSDFYYPTETQTFENNYFSVVYEPQWIIHRLASTNDNYEFKVNFRHTDSMDNYLASYSISVRTDNEHENAEEYANANFELLNELKSEYRSDIQINSDEIFGIPSYKVSQTVQAGLLNYNYESYYFDYNDTVYYVCTSVPINDDGTVASAIQKLIDNTTLK